MKKLITQLTACTAVVVMLMFGQTAKAQMLHHGDVGFSIGVDAGIPTGDIHDGSSFALGGTARLQFGLASNLAFTVTSGYYNFFAKSYTTTFTAGNTTTTVTTKGDNYGIVPLKAGIKAFFDKNAYFGAEAGAGFETRKNGDTKLLLSPALGYAGDMWDLSVRYENFSGQSVNYGMVAARLAVGF